MLFVLRGLTPLASSGCALTMQLKLVGRERVEGVIQLGPPTSGVRCADAADHAGLACRTVPWICVTEHMEVGQGTVGVRATSPRSPTKPQKLLHGDLPPAQPKQVSEMRRQVHGRQICRKGTCHAAAHITVSRGGSCVQSSWLPWAHTSVLSS